jgi:hypothetical protein
MIARSIDRWIEQEKEYFMTRIKSSGWRMGEKQMVCGSEEEESSI